jgi:hypothetical protein
MLVRLRRRTKLVGNGRELLILVCGLMILVFAAIERRQGQQSIPARAAAFSTGCEPMGWFPSDFGMKDHTVFIFDGFYYIAAIRRPAEYIFAYGRSADLCNWEDLGTVIDRRTLGEWDGWAIWAPFVLEDNGVFYMYYTGVTQDFTQSIMLATTSNPADPDSWQRQGMVFQPDHDGMLWQAGSWADCRDATVYKEGDTYYMYYTGSDIDGPIVGLATSVSPHGPWFDWGMTLTLPQSGGMAESPTIVRHAGFYYLLYFNTNNKEEYRIGPSPAGPWSDAFPLTGWANEVWVGQDGLDYTSYIHGYKIAIERYLWNDYYSPPGLFVGATIHRHFLPILNNP